MRVHSFLLTVAAMVGRLFSFGWLPRRGPALPATPAGWGYQGRAWGFGLKRLLGWGAYLALACAAGGCGPALPTPVAPPATAGGVYWSPEDARRLVEERNSHAAKVETLQSQLTTVQTNLASLTAEETRIKAQLKLERQAAVRETIYWWLGICAVLAGACTLAGFVFPSVSEWLWRGAVGLTAVAAILGVVAVLVSWWVWVGAGAIVAGVLWWLSSHAKANGNALVETVQGVEKLKPVVGTVYKAVMRKAQSARTNGLVDRIRKRLGGA